MFNFTKIGLNLENAAKSASAMKDERLTAAWLAKAEKLVHKSPKLTIIEIQAIMNLYDRVIVAAANLPGKIPIKPHCDEMKGFLRARLP